ncbi:MAG TPA: AbrB/MazE/SpoVT family DNA-binding domain-containing protein [Caulobacteraceae bacterium]|nr:AbrB/MazE/SpoVT family DNA-binding domain-containing protein [Caulobacteraceae bacterium]
MDQDRMRTIAAPHATISDKIRALAAAGAPRAEIARFLGKRYQHVRNVLEGDAQAGGGYVLGKADLSGVREAGAGSDPEVEQHELIERRGGSYWLRPRDDGSLVLPPEIAGPLGVTAGGRVFATFTDGELRIVSFERALEQARALLRKHVPPGVSLVDEFIAERRAHWGETDDGRGS